MKEHDLKTIDEFWYAVVAGAKTFEVRKNDRGFEVDDILILRCLEPDKKTPTEHVMRKRVSYVLAGGQFGLAEDHVVLGLAPAPPAAREWGWYAGNSEERYEIGPLPSRQAAIDEAIGQCVYAELDPEPPEHPDWRIRIHLIEAAKNEIADITFDGDRIIEELEDGGQCEEWMDPEGGEGLFSGLTKDDTDVLGKRFATAFQEWAADKKLNNFCFRDTRNEEVLVLPHPSPAPADVAS